MFPTAIRRAMRVIPVPCLSDNYAYLVLSSSATAPAVCIDPVQPNQVLQVLKEHAPEATLVQCLTTHHHWDHAGGNGDLKKMMPSIEVIGGDERVQGIEKKVEHGEKWKVGKLNIAVIGTGCHTRGSVSYVISEEDVDGPAAVFTGDTLFIGGCGKFFEGTGKDMLTALDRLAELPKDTLVYCGHEYTRSNYKFAASVDPNNSMLKEERAWAEQNACTVPSTMRKELDTNPFMRTRDEAMQKATDATDPAIVMDRLREMKNGFGGWLGTLQGGVEMVFTYAKFKLVG